VSRQGFLEALNRFKVSPFQVTPDQNPLQEGEGTPSINHTKGLLGPVA